MRICCTRLNLWTLNWAWILPQTFTTSSFGKWTVSKNSPNVPSCVSCTILIPWYVECIRQSQTQNAFGVEFLLNCVSAGMKAYVVPSMGLFSNFKVGSIQKLGLETYQVSQHKLCLYPLGREDRWAMIGPRIWVKAQTLPLNLIWPKLP